MGKNLERIEERTSRAKRTAAFAEMCKDSARTAQQNGSADFNNRVSALHYYTFERVIRGMLASKQVSVVQMAHALRFVNNGVTSISLYNVVRKYDDVTDSDNKLDKQGAEVYNLHYFKQVGISADSWSQGIGAINSYFAYHNARRIEAENARKRADNEKEAAKLAKRWKMARENDDEELEDETRRKLGGMGYKTTKQIKDLLK